MKLMALFFAVGVLSLAQGASVEPEVVPIWPDGKIPFKLGDAPERVTPSKDDIIRITDVNVPTLTVCLAPSNGEANPAVLICPGGGYSILAWNHEGTEVAAWLNSMGISAFILKYRVPGNREGAFCDAQRAMGFIRRNSKRFNIDESRLGIIGFSAGAHLAVRTSTNFQRRAYEAVDDADQFPSRPDFAMIIYPAYLFREGYTLAPELSVSALVPPTFLLQAQDDGPYVDSCLAYFIALKAAKVPAELHVFPDGGHGYGMRKKGKSTDVWPQLAAVWLSRVVK